jgi:hypothetical protein
LCEASVIQYLLPHFFPFSYEFGADLLLHAGRCSSCIGAAADGVAAGAALLFAIPATCFAWCGQQTTEDHKLLVAASWQPSLASLKYFH